MSQKAGTLSGGEQQMLAIGRALMARPKLLLLDEPSMGLAPILVERIFEIIREINEQGTTILLVEQNALMALDAAHRGYVLETGTIVLADDAEGARDERAGPQDLPRRGMSRGEPRGSRAPSSPLPVHDAHGLLAGTAGLRLPRIACRRRAPRLDLQRRAGGRAARAGTDAGTAFATAWAIPSAAAADEDGWSTRAAPASRRPATRTRPRRLSAGGTPPGGTAAVGGARVRRGTRRSRAGPRRGGFCGGEAVRMVGPET